MNTEQIKDMHLLYNAVYNEELREKFDEYNNTVKKAVVGEEVEAWVNSLVEEGYDLSEYTWDEMAEIYLNEANRGDENLSRSQKQKRRNASFEAGHTHQKATRFTDAQKKELNATSSTAEDESSRQTTLLRQRSTKNTRGKRSQYESYDLYDVILSHLLDEGYAESVEQAEIIMVNMSEDWRDTIVEGYKKFPTKKVMDKAGKLMGSSAGKGDPESKKKEKRGIKMMDTMMQHTPDY